MLLIRVGDGFSWWRFRLRLDLCLGVGPVNQKSTGKKWFPKLCPFSGPKNDRTKRAPIMGAQFVLSKMGPEFDPTFRRTTQINSKTRVPTFHRSMPTLVSRGVPRAPDQPFRQRHVQRNPKSVWQGTLTAPHRRRRTYLLSTSHLGVENCGTLNSGDVDNETDIYHFAGVITSPMSPGLALSIVCSCCRRRLLPSRVSFLSSLSSGALCCFTNT